MLHNFRFVVLLLAGVLSSVSAQNALTDGEIQILIDNGYIVTMNEQEGTITYEHHGLPEHTSEGGWGNPNDAQMVNHSYTVPLKPTVANVNGCAGGLGVIGLAISGGAYYNPYTVFGWDAVNGECAEEFDECHGHPAPQGEYHYHGIPHCLYTGDLKDKFLGVALDGYPIYGPMDNSGKNWTSADLDECHGHYYNGRYVYRATYDFPYIISCFHGDSVKTQSGSNEQRPLTDGQIPALGRKRRHASFHEINRRQIQIPIPPGMEDDKCWNAKYENWDTIICHVVCPNAGQDLENCKKETGSAAGHTNSIVYILALTYVLYISL